MQVFILFLLLSFLIISVVRGSLLQKRNNVSSDDIQTILESHNKYRKLHDSLPLSWNDNLAIYANLWSQKCIVNYSGILYYGENMAGRTLSWPQTVDAWYNEEKKYDYTKPGFNLQTGHFTQIIWKSTKSVGCAVSYCDNIKGNLYVCEYEPRGNIIFSNGEAFTYYKTNVTLSSNNK